MTLYIYGNQHWSPFSRQLLRQRYRSILAYTKTGPSFIAVEAGEHIFRSIVLAQREVFLDRARNDEILRSLPKQLIEEFALTIGHEADAHADIFPSETTLLWLDSYRDNYQIDQELASTLANRYVHFLKQVLAELTGGFTQERLLAEFQRQLNLNGSAPTDFERDRIWADLIIKKQVDTAPSAVGVVVVGAGHIQQTGEYLGRLLMDAGVDHVSEDLTKGIDKGQQEAGGYCQLLARLGKASF
jgi:hypothetical protein